jgi:hypothetical protein
MKDLLREYIGEIALLIYILFPLLKRWYDRRKKQRKRDARPARPESAARTPTEPREEAPSSERARAEPTEQRPKPPATKPRPAQPDFLGAARAEGERLEQEASRLLDQAITNPRLARVAPALRHDLLGRVGAIQRSLQGSPTLSTIVQDTAALRGLDELLRYLSRIMRQRMLAPRSIYSQADRMADDVYGPLLAFCNAQNLSLKTSQPITVSGDWGRSVAPRFAPTHLAPIRLPDDFERSLWQWPTLAAEVARDFYYSFEHLEQDLHERLKLPYQVQVPSTDGQVDTRWLTQLFGPWLSDMFVNVMGTVMLGPAYVESLQRRQRQPTSPQRTAAILPNGPFIDERPPARLRVYTTVRVLHHLGRHRQADALWEGWEAEHPDIQLYFLPVGDRWAGLADHTLHSLVDSLVDRLVLQPWPELEGFPLMNIPELAYLHAEHAEVERLTEPLAGGAEVDADSRWIIAAAVLAAAAQPALHDSILEAAYRSIARIEASAREPQLQTARPARAQAIGRALMASLRNPSAMREAIVLGEALGPRRHEYRR